MSTVVIVGGGVSGIVSSIVLSQTFSHVILIERQHVLGGLLNSIITDKGYSFDYGTHLLSETGLTELDELLLDDVIDNKESWQVISPLRVSTYNRGSLQHDGPCLDGRLLDPVDYNQGVVELLSSMSEENQLDSVAAQLYSQYGPVFTNQLFKPVLNKLFDIELEQLAVGAHELFVPKRIKLLNEEVTKQLKSIPQFDEILSFHHIVDQRKSYYPRKEGIGKWIESLIGKMESKGVKVILNDYIERINVTEGNVDSITLGVSRETINLDYLIWTIPPSMLLKTIGHKAIATPPQIRKVRLYHFVFNRPFDCQSAYLNIYDPEYDSFRVTFYSNLNVEHSGFRCTVEVLYTHGCNIPEEKIINELKEIGVVNREAETIYSLSEKLNTGFPLLTKQYVNDLRMQNQWITDNLSNVSIVGKSGGSGFFLNDVLRETYRIVKEIRC